MIVVKLGGSILQSGYLTNWLNALVAANGTHLVVVPGGGVFADQVRDTAAQHALDDESSHKMALLAMQQYGELLCGLNPAYRLASVNQFNDYRQSRYVPVWSVYADACLHFDGPRNWDSTSDTLSLWLARKVQADHLFVVKAAEVVQPVDLDVCSRSGLLDANFARYRSGFNGAITVCNVKNYDQFASMTANYRENRI